MTCARTEPVAGESASEASARPLPVSVLVLAYNHERFIGKALQSVAAQETNFEYEVVIGDDCSMDRTVEIAETFRGAWPGRLRILKRSRNLGVTRNFLDSYAHCSGRLIAILESDDYWTDETKLQRQFDLMQSEPAASCCFHQVLLLENGKVSSHLHGPPPPRREFDLSDIIPANVICNCSTIMMRNGLIERFPDWFAESHYYDWPLHMLNARRGPIVFIPRVMSMYRIHSTSAWHGADRVARANSVIWLLEKLRDEIDEGYRREFQQALSHWEQVVWHETAARRARRLPGRVFRWLRGNLGAIKRRGQWLLRAVPRRGESPLDTRGRQLQQAPPTRILSTRSRGEAAA